MKKAVALRNLLTFCLIIIWLLRTYMVIKKVGKKNLEEMLSYSAPIELGLNQNYLMKDHQCTDDTHLMPDCMKCIPGLVPIDQTNDQLESGSSSAPCILPPGETANLREKIKKISEERFGTPNFHLYPYLSVPPLTERQAEIGRMLAKDRPRKVIDIGPYTNPIWMFLPEGYCPEVIVAVEPCGEVVTNSSKAWHSMMHPCKVDIENSTKRMITKTHRIVVPMTAKEFFESPFFHDSYFDAIVCVGCDHEYGPKPSQLASLLKPFFFYLEYASLYLPSRKAFNEESFALNVCGVGTKPLYKKEWIFDPDKEPHLKDHRYSLNRLLVTYKCTRFQAELDGYKINCDTDGKEMYGNLACMAEMHSVLRVKDKAFWPVGAETNEINNILAIVPKQRHNCTFCDEVLRGYRLTEEKWRIPFSIDSTPALEGLKKRYGSLASEPSNLRVHEAANLLKYAQITSKQGTKQGSLDALIAATVARRILHAGQPIEELMRNGGLLYQAILDYNTYLVQVVDNDLLLPIFSNNTLGIKHKLSICPVHADKTYKDIATKRLEPILPDTRNYGFHELGLWIDMFPYRVLPTFKDFMHHKYQKKVLVDVGTNGFYGSAKSLVDMYAPFADFDEIHLFEPDLKGMHVPPYYMNKYKIFFHQTLVKVGSRDMSDVLMFLRENTSPNDFVVLKFDVDEKKSRGLTMEWGFLADLMNSQEAALVDELFIELHFYYRILRWWHADSHSMRQAYDILRQLRSCGIAVHSWP